jgi:uncharacterized protein
MKLLFHLGHPAHFHLFKNVIINLRANHNIYVVIKKKDILSDLLKMSGLKYFNILPKGRRDNIFSIALGQLIQNVKMYKLCLRLKPDILIGTSVATSHVGFILRIPSINLNEDDADVVPFYSNLSYPFSTNILAPLGCRMGRWSKGKVTFYNSYHELSYLHPDHFTPKVEIANQYVNTKSPYFILRFAKLGAHHDKGVEGISDAIAIKLIKIMDSYGRVYITSERILNEELEKHRIQINALDMHHILAFASMFVGDSQTMAAEAAMLGVPFIRFNDFVGRISYLEELENKYGLGYGLNSTAVDSLYKTVRQLINLPDRAPLFQERRKLMLADKIDLSKLLVWLIERYPNSVKAYGQVT